MNRSLFLRSLLKNRWLWLGITAVILLITFTPSQAVNGNIDIIFSNYNQVNRVCIGNGSSSFPCVNILGDVRTSRGVDTGDLNNDGNIDVVFATATGQRPRVCFGTGTGGFSSCADTDGNTTDDYDVALGDLNNDGNLDAVFAVYSSSARWCLGNGTGTFVSCSNFGPSNSNYAVEVGFLDGDPLLDVVFARAGQNVFCRGNGAGGFFGCSFLPFSYTSYDVALGDINNDGRLDAVFADYNSSNQRCYGNGTGGYSSCSNTPGPTYNSRGVALGDLNGDNRLDAIYNNRQGHPNQICLNNGSGPATCSTIGGSTGGQGYHAAMADMDNDGNLDGIFGNYGQANYLCYGNGAGNFNTCANISSGLSTYGVAVVDLGGYLVVTTETDVVDADAGSCAGITLASLPGPDGLLSLREAICAANNTPGHDNIIFDSSLDGTAITLTIPGTNEDANLTGDLDITDDLTITGNGVDATIVDANDTTLNDRAFHVVSADSLTLNQLTVRNGRPLGGYPNGCGGAVSALVAGSSLTINNGRLTNNVTTSHGGAICTNGAGTTVQVNDSTLDNNSTNVGGTNGGALWAANGTVTINRSTFTNNAVLASGDAGAIFSSGTLNINNSTFSGNSTNGFGGAIYGINTMIVRSSTFYDNSATATGQAIFNAGGPFTLWNNILKGNPGTICGGAGISSFNANLVDDASCAAAPNPVTNFDTTLQDNGGPTNTHAILPGSNAHDSGVAGCEDHTGTDLATDQRGVPRPQEAACDIGAYEYIPPAVGGASGGLGPGGVGHTDGGTTLESWWRADKEVTASGTDVTGWADYSGNNNDADGTGHEPTYVASYANLNNQPVLDFDGNSDYLLFNGLVTPLAASSWYGVLEADNIPAGGYAALMARDGAWAGSNTHVNFTFGLFEHAVFDRSPSVFSGGTWSTGSQYIAGAVNNSGGGSIDLWQNGASAGSTAIVVPSVQTYGPGRIGDWTDDARNFNGRLPEIFLFADALPEVERILVENYLSSKYDIALAANDVFFGDTIGGGNFDLDVAGIGQFAGSQHSQSHSAGIIVRDVDYLKADGDWLTFGHRDFVPGKTSNDLPTDGDWTGATNARRWNRHWYFTRIDVGISGGTVDLIFDLSEGGMYHPADVPAAPVENYRLLGRSGSSGDFEDITADSGATVVIVDDQIMFLGVDVSVLGSNFTVGSLDDETSPTNLTLASASANSPNSMLVVLLMLVVLGGATAFVFGRRR